MRAEDTVRANVKARDARNQLDILQDGPGELLDSELLKES